MSDEMQVATRPRPRPPPPVAAAPHRRPRRRSLDRLMNMADHCLHDHLLRQATEMYFEMLDRPGAGDA